MPRKKIIFQDMATLPDETLLAPGEVAEMLRVDSKTVTRWAAKWPDRLPSIKTLGGHRRFKVADVRAIFAKEADPLP